MKIANKKILSLNVLTKSGQKIGRVDSFSVDTESQSIVEYEVIPTELVKRISHSSLIISRGQILEITNTKMVVDDNVVGSKEKVVRQGKQSKTATATLKETN